MGDSILDVHPKVVAFLGGPVPATNEPLTDQDLDRVLPDMSARNQAPIRSRAHSTAELNVVASGSSGGLLVRPRS